MVAEMLSLPVAFDGLGVSLAIALLVAGMRVSPRLAALLHDLGIDGIGTNFPLVIIPSSLTLAGGLAANLLLGMVRGRLKDLLAIRTMSETHQDGSGSECHSFILSRSPIQPEAADKKFSPYRVSCRVFTASLRMGLLTIKPAGLMLFYSGADR